jgi:hypothetical protein
MYIYRKCRGRQKRKTIDLRREKERLKEKKVDVWMGR